MANRSKQTKEERDEERRRNAAPKILLNKHDVGQIQQTREAAALKKEKARLRKAANRVTASAPTPSLATMTMVRALAARLAKMPGEWTALTLSCAECTSMVRPAPLSPTSAKREVPRQRKAAYRGLSPPPPPPSRADGSMRPNTQVLRPLQLAVGGLRLCKPRTRRVGALCASGFCKMKASLAKYRKGRGAKYAEALADDDDSGAGHEEGLSISATTFVAGGRQSAFPGGPFSALTPSMCPHNAAVIGAEDNAEFRYDEFGLRVEVEDGPEHCSSKILSVPFVENPQHRLKWIAHLEFTHNQVVEDLTWDKIEPLFNRTDKLGAMVRDGVPHSLRPFVWPRLCGALLKRKQANFGYKEAVRAANERERPAVAKQIEKDLLRTLPLNVCFSSAQSAGVPRLRRLLRAVSYLYPEIGYCQGTGVIVASLLLFLEEEDAFWIVCTLIEDILPGCYFSGNLLGLQADQRVLRLLIADYLPRIDAVLRENDIEVSLISLNWFLTVFASVLHMKILLRIWDVLFYEGTFVLFQVTLAMLKLKEEAFVSQMCSADVFNLLSELPASVEDVDVLFDAVRRLPASLTHDLVRSLRKKELALLMVDQGVLVNPYSSDQTNLPKQRVQRRRLQRSKSLVEQIFGGGASTATALSTDGRSTAPTLADDDPRNKNVRQTELLVDLKDAISRVGRHFGAVDPAAFSAAAMQADYSAESHSRDHDVFARGRQKGQRRARALLDFERQEDDELGFRKNDVVNILSQRDEHCWVGELNGLRGWFPAKFVEMLDERGKSYSAQGDDAVTEAVTDLVRGALASALKGVLEHGMKRSLVLGSACHPWLFIEEVARSEVQNDFHSVYSRLVLCKTFRLDEDGKVLTPEELLYRGVQRVNATHNAARAQMDVKLRSLLCVALNEQALHLWFELFCCCRQEIRNKWFHSWSFVRSPAWVQIKCELRLLAQFPFSLNADLELPAMSPSKSQSLLAAVLGQPKTEDDESGQSAMEQPLKQSVKDMLVKHHLFSWDL